LLFLKNMNSEMKINILLELKEGAWGGANQYLKLLKKELSNRGIYEENANRADVIIFNSYHNITKAILMKILFPKKVLVHRLGPYFYLHRNPKWKIIDSLIIEISNSISDLIVFQSDWSYRKAISKFDLNKSKKCSIIGNSSDRNIFYPKDNTHMEGKIKLITASWSSNIKKGAKYYEFLDNNLDFSKYDMTFVGNSKIKFKNIKIIDPLPSNKLADEMRKNDIFISAVEDDACSNTIVEALSCGLPLVALASGGNAEIIKKGGELFSTNHEMLEKIELVKNNYLHYKNNIEVNSIENSADQYLNSIKEVRVQGRGGVIKKFKLCYLYVKTCLILLLFKIIR